MARGLPRENARQLLIEGFLDGLRQRFPELGELEDADVAG